MPRTTRRAFATTLVLGLSLLVVAPATASAAGEPVSKPGRMVPLLREDVSGNPGIAAPRAQRLTVVPGKAATPRSTWQVAYDAGFNANPTAKSAFQAAVNIWAGIISSPVPIKVTAAFGDLGPGVLGYAGPDAIMPVSGAGDGTSWYPSALADALKGTDLRPGQFDIDAAFSSTEPGIYYGLDSNPPANHIDFMSVVLHELGHGLGFSGSADYYQGLGHYEAPRFIFDYYNTDSAGSQLILKPNNSTSLGTAFTNNSVWWNGAQAKAANGGNKPKLYAPSPWEGGSSIAHLDEDVYGIGTANSLMTPYLSDQEVVHSPGQITLGILRDMGWNAVLARPDAPTNVRGEALDGSVDVFWSAAAPNGSPVTSYTVTASPGGATATGTASPLRVSGLTDGTSYTFTVTATNAVGTSDPSAPSAAVVPAPDTVAPTVTITSGPTNGHGPASGTISFVGADAGHTSPTLTYSCTLDAVTSPCSSPFSYSGLAHGSSHTFSVTATDASSNTSAPASLSAWTVDAVAPSVTTPVLPTYTLASRVGLTAGGGDTGSGLKNWDFRYRLAPFSGNFTALTFPSSWQGVAGGSIGLTAAQAMTYCFAARSRDLAGNVSAWSPERCTSTALDDRGLAAGSGWTRGTYPRHFKQTITSTPRTGVILTRKGVVTRRLALVATACRGCGTVGVYLNGRLVKNVNLGATSTRYQQVIHLISFPGIVSGTVTLKTLTRGTFFIDGLVMSKT